MIFTRRRAKALFLMVLLTGAAQLNQAIAANPPTVLVTIKPLHSLLAAVTNGVLEPSLLLDGTYSPHHYQMKPSAVKKVHQSDLVFWVGEGLESFLIKTVRVVSDKSKVQRLIDVPGLSILPMRNKESHNHNGEAHDDSDHADHMADHDSGLTYPDNHFWLDPVNASVLVGYFADTLSDIDPINADTYQSNAQMVQAQLLQLSEELDTLLEPSRGKPYLVFHDSFQYFEKRFNLTSAGVISIQPDAQPGAQRLRDLQHQIEHDSVHCIFSEPQFQSRSVQMLVANTDIKHALIDPLGSAEPAGVTMYLDWLKNTAVAFNDCLSE